jgi:hypothetical protein
MLLKNQPSNFKNSFNFVTFGYQLFNLKKRNEVKPKNLRQAGGYGNNRRINRRIFSKRFIGGYPPKEIQTRCGVGWFGLL